VLVVRADWWCRLTRLHMRGNAVRCPALNHAGRLAAENHCPAVPGPIAS